nr:amidohydrolase [Sphingomonas sp. CDS-1]
MKAKACLAIILLAFAISGEPALSAVQSVSEKEKIAAVLTQSYPHLEALYRDIHSHPELAFQERRTAALLAREMRQLGFVVTEKVGGTGVVAIYRNGPGPVVLVRTEMDALPIREKTGLSYASNVQARWTEEPGKRLMPDAQDGRDAPVPTELGAFVSHACGHDIHMAWWVGTAQALVMLKGQWSGTLMFVAQPAEETLSGARAMLADGLFERFPKPDFAFTAHVIPLPAGSVLLKDGPALAAADNLSIRFHGRGGHGASPNSTIDPIMIGAHFANDVQAVISREKDPALPGVVTIGSFRAGEAANAIPDSAELRLTLRAAAPTVRAALLAGVLRTAKAVADMAGAPSPDVALLSSTGPTINDPALTARMALAMKDAFGPALITIPADANAGMASDDFSEWVEAGVPAVYFAIGGMSPAMLADYRARHQSPPVNHSAYFHPAPEPAIKTGVEVLALAVLMAAPR